METYYSDWYKKYPGCWKDRDYLTDYNQMRWYVNGELGSILTDPDNIKEMGAEEVLHLLFND
ncbi:MAG: hypothetical protein K2I60_00225 [Oscillospiraceae bacterium]|nr:hypothetical protein [Oscillospiraceae bacterium]